MNDDTKINALVNISQSKVVEKTYDDLVSPANKKLGNALSTVIDVGNTILWPVKWANERVRIFFESNLRKYEKKLSEIPEEKVTPAPSELSVPILERFTYVSNNDISNAFVKLLTSASSTDTISSAHPGFVAIIDRLSPDEARILTHLKRVEAIPKLTFSFWQSDELETYVTAIQDSTGLEKKIELLFANNIGIYFNNLTSLGLIEKTDYYYQQFENEYSEIEKIYADDINAVKPKDVTPENEKRRRYEKKSMFVLTEYGKLFIAACID